MNTISVNGNTVQPSKILCVGRNYRAHIEELGNEIPDSMVVFNKPNSAISDTLYSDINNQPLHYESELAFTVKEGKLDAVGFGLDLTKRALQSTLKAKGLPWERAKAFDGPQERLTPKRNYDTSYWWKQITVLFVLGV